jgi:hypothetical protein
VEARQAARTFALALAVVLSSLSCVGSYGRERLLPRPDPLPVHAGGSLSEGEQRRLADVRRFLGPYDQELLERTLVNLGTDPRLPRAEVDAALRRALAGFVSPAGFCERLAGELRGLWSSGPEVTPPAHVAVVVPIELAHARWLSPAGRRRYGEPRALASAVRDDAVEPGALDLAASLGDSADRLFVVDAAAFDGPGPSAARRACLSGPPAASYVVVRIPAERLSGALRIPTTADAVCRPLFEPAPVGAASGVNCAGNPEYVTAPLPLGAAGELRLSR